ncbi:hypothetical protein P886_0296 [Alteromonadaceae bacterium 2753L.S.0a.02]|nr:hypothetical protein P886_0296 [Alteromonadaceae bacterium 2753L.S.0a.02]
MRLIILLLAVVIIGLIVSKQLSSGKPQDSGQTDTTSSIDTPKVPSAPQDVPKFEKQINEFMIDAAAERDKKMREQEGN